MSTIIVKPAQTRGFCRSTRQKLPAPVAGTLHLQTRPVPAVRLHGTALTSRPRRAAAQRTFVNNFVPFYSRDLKCENILLDSKNEIKVSDFGFARILHKTDTSQTFCGSAAYTAPEILLGKPYHGPPADIWSMGVILYIMV
jgi:serine/threonine protein kinase